MILIEWSSALSVNIDEIDRQHRILVDMLNRLYDAVASKHGNDVVGPILHEMVEYTKVHFAVEEALMSILDYPEFKTHKVAHDKLVEKLGEFLKQFNESQADVSKELLEFLKSWLTQHIRKTDMEYSKFFEKRLGSGDDDEEEEKGGGFFSWLFK